MAMNNSLAEVHPELVSEWSEKNLTLTPDDITFASYGMQEKRDLHYLLLNGRRIEKR